MIIWEGSNYASLAVSFSCTVNKITCEDTEADCIIWDNPTISSDGLNDFGKQKYYTQKIMAKNVSQWIPIILEQNFPSDQEVTNKWSNIYKNLDKKNETIYEKKMNSILQPPEIILKLNNIETEAASNSVSQFEKGKLVISIPITININNSYYLDSMWY